jgi:hypothetical protein
VAIDWRAALVLAEQLRELGDVRRDPPRSRFTIFFFSCIGNEFLAPIQWFFLFDLSQNQAFRHLLR